MEESTIAVDEIKKKSVRGVVVLTGRTFILQVISFVAQLVLFAYLGAYEFGVFAIVSAIVNFLVYFSDVGLAAALIQKKESPSNSDLKTTFTVQQILVLVIISIVYLLTPFFVNKYGLNTDGKYLLYALAFSLLLSSLKSIPSVLLERKLEFIKLVFPQILEQLVYNLLLIFLAIKGFGITSFTIAILVRSLIGLVTIYFLQPWKPGLDFSLRSLRDLFKFGVPYQLNTFLATIKDDGMTMLLGGILGPVGVGVLSFAQKVARYPLTFFMDTVTKVTFPAFSRLQDEKDHLERSVTRSIFFICFLVFPSLVGLVLLMPMLITLIPKYGKWAVALLPLVFVSVNYAFAAATTQLTNLLNAIGKIRITFYLMIMWTLLTWLLVPLFSSRLGALGASIAYALVGVSSLVAIYQAKKYVNFSITDSIAKPLFGSFIMAIVIIFVKRYLDVSWLSFEILVLTGVIAYGVSMVSMMGVSLINDAKRSIGEVFSKK